MVNKFIKLISILLGTNARKQWTSKIDKICFSCGSMRQPLLTSAKTQEVRIIYAIVKVSAHLQMGACVHLYFTRTLTSIQFLTTFI